MCSDEVVVERANLSDVDGILKLADANDAEHGGTLTGHLDRKAVADSIGRIASIVARKTGTVVGFLLTSEKTYSYTPVERKMVEAYPGEADGYIYGPICVDASMRGHGLAERISRNCGGCYLAGKVFFSSGSRMSPPSKLTAKWV